MIDLISDGLLLLACIGAACYCGMLSRKIGKMNKFETGLGSAIAVLSGQVDDLRKALAETEAATRSTSTELREQISEANSVAERLDILLTGLDELPEDNIPYSNDHEERDIDTDNVIFVHKTARTRTA